MQCAKLLGDVSVMQFYPSKFVLVTDLLDTFGEKLLQQKHSNDLMCALLHCASLCRTCQSLDVSLQESMF